MRSQTVWLDSGEVVRRRSIPRSQTRCECGKSGYTGRKVAASVAALERGNTGEPIYAYRCDRGGHCWHIGHNCTKGGHEPTRPSPTEPGVLLCWCGGYDNAGHRPVDRAGAT